MPRSLDALNMDRSWTLFLDRDGVINKKIDGDYVKRSNEFEWLDGALDALVLLAPLFKTIVVVTNQQGVGKGLMNEKDLNDIHQSMLHRVRSAGGRIDAVYFAPWLKETNHPERKPGIGMAQNALRDFPYIQFSKSLMVGDSPSDVMFGKEAGMHTVMLGTKPTGDGVQPDYTFGTLYDFAQAMLQTMERTGG